MGFFEGAALGHMKLMKRKLSTSDMGIGWVNMKSGVVSLHLTALPLMEVVKVEYVVAEDTSGNVVKLSSAAMNLY